MFEISGNQDQGQDVVCPKRGRPIKKFNSVDEYGWGCDTCKNLFTGKKSKFLEYEYCKTKRCIKCLKIPERTCKIVGDRSHFPCYYDHCIEKEERIQY